MISASVPEKRDRSTVFAVTLGAIALLGLALRTWYARLPVTADEAYTFLTYTRGTALTALGKYNVPNNHVLNSLLIHIARFFAGDSYVALRLPVFAFGLATILAGALVWRELARETVLVALATALFISFSARFVHVSVEARGYGIEAFFFLVSLAAADRLLRTRATFDLILFALTSAAGLLCVPTHLYAVASIGFWMLFRVLTEFRAEFKPRFDVVSRAHIRLAGFAVLGYLPVIVYVLINHTKIEPAEPLANLKISLPHRMVELAELWSTEHSTIFVLWLALGAVALLIFGWRSRRQHVWLLVACMLGPLAVFVVTRRVAPFARVWTYLLPSLFALSLLGWTALIELLRLSTRARMAAIGALAAIPLLATAVSSLRRLPETLVAQNLFSAERAWPAIMSLQSGDHIGFPSEFHQQIRFLALTQAPSKPGDGYAPLARRTDGDVDIVEQNGRVAQKVNPLAAPGRVFLYATSAADLKPMENWLRPYLPAHAKLRVKSGTGFPALYEFETTTD